METVISRAYELTIVSSTISTRDIYKMRRKGRKKKEERYSSKSFPTLHVVGSANDRTTRSSIRNLDRFVENDPTALLSFFFLPSTSEPSLARLGIGIFRENSCPVTRRGQEEVRGFIAGGPR